MIGSQLVMFEDLTITALVELVNHLRATTSEDQMILRESELDALFTLADMRVRGANRDLYEIAVGECAQIRRAHDLVHASDAMAAAAQLESLIDAIVARSGRLSPGAQSRV